MKELYLKQILEELLKKNINYMIGVMKGQEYLQEESSLNTIKMII